MQFSFWRAPLRITIYQQLFAETFGNVSKVCWTSLGTTALEQGMASPEHALVNFFDSLIAYPYDIRL
jgi:hypothetical protein